MSFRLSRRKVARASVVLTLLATIALCCDTPVYRFAMYNWKPTPYEVYYFYVGDVPQQDQAINAALRKASEGNTRTNIVLTAYNMEEDPALENVTILPEVRTAWLKDNQSPTSGYMVVGPHGAVLYRGKLRSDDVPRIDRSPARTTLSKDLENGNACVFIFLPGKDDKKNAAAKKKVERVLAEVKSGKISLYTPPGKSATSDNDLDAILKAQRPVVKSSGSTKKEDTKKPKSKPKAGDVDKGKEKKAVPTEVSMIVVDRSSLSERWFVRNLLSLEGGLDEESEPMVFPVYGRARALLPLIGEGVSYDNLVRQLEFVTGACSCEIKDQNPGIDLLVRYDWEAAAGKVADKFGREEGNENRFADNDLFPQILIPSSKDVVEIGTDKKGDTQAGSDSTKQQTDEPKAEKKDPVATAQGTGNPSSAKIQPAVNKAADPGPDKADKVTASVSPKSTSQTPGEDADAPKATREQAGVSGVMIIGTGIGLALLLLMVATMVVMRPR